MSPRRRECQFNGRDAAFDAGFRHGYGFFRVVAANDGNDADFFNFIDDFDLIHCVNSSHTLKKISLYKALQMTLLEGFQFFSRRQAFIVSGYLNGHGPDRSASAGSIFQIQAVQEGTGKADGKTVTGTDRIDDVLDVIARYVQFFFFRTDISTIAAAELDDDSLNASLEVIPGNILFTFPTGQNAAFTEARHDDVRVLSGIIDDPGHGFL